ncbi:MAG: septum formation initiator family protein, partial [candidate division NC10 bacterium]|nr:septum formation initiator family protein [candidate division NC10 bacterium]
MGPPWRSYLPPRRKRARAALTREIGELAAANAALAEEVRALRTDPARVEAIAREE